LNADSLLSGYCRLLYERLGTYEEVARRAGLDRRTVKAYVNKDVKIQ
jgi:DNA-binding CsgD family transcriptional regulator